MPLPVMWNNLEEPNSATTKQTVVASMNHIDRSVWIVLDARYLWGLPVGGSWSQQSDMTGVATGVKTANIKHDKDGNLVAVFCRGAGLGGLYTEYLSFGKIRKFNIVVESDGSDPTPILTGRVGLDHIAGSTWLIAYAASTGVKHELLWRILTSDSDGLLSGATNLDNPTAHATDTMPWVDCAVHRGVDYHFVCNFSVGELWHYDNSTSAWYQIDASYGQEALIMADPLDLTGLTLHVFGREQSPITGADFAHFERTGTNSWQKTILVDSGTGCSGFHASIDHLGNLYCVYTEWNSVTSRKDINFRYKKRGEPWSRPQKVTDNAISGTTQASDNPNFPYVAHPPTWDSKENLRDINVFFMEDPAGASDFQIWRNAGINPFNGVDNRTTYMLDVINGPAPAWFRWKGDEATEDPFLNASIFTVLDSVLDDGELIFGHGRNGKLYRLGVGNHDNGDAIELRFTQGWESMGFPWMTKRFRAIHVDVEELTHPITLNWSVDYGAETGVITINSSKNTRRTWGPPGLWGVGKWLGTLGAQRQTGVYPLPDRAVGQAIRVQVVEAGTGNRPQLTNLEIGWESKDSIREQGGT